jgi:hypothetical protein
VLYPDELGGGFKKYMELKIEKTMYAFVCTYVWRIKPNIKWKKLMTKNPGGLFFCIITQSNIVYVLELSRMGRICGIRPRRDKLVIPEQVPRKRQDHNSVGEREGRERVVYWCGTRKAGVLLHG